MNDIELEEYSVHIHWWHDNDGACSCYECPNWEYQKLSYTFPYPWGGTDLYSWVCILKTCRVLYGNDIKKMWKDKTLTVNKDFWAYQYSKILESIKA